MKDETVFNNFFERGQFNHCSLFSGIGGFDLAAHWIGWNNLFQVEKDEWCRKVLQKNFPESKRYGDIKDFNGKEYTGTVDIISGGFPCQPFSIAGKQRGKDDDRYLWEEMLRVVREIKAPVVVGENVTGIIGLALDTVLSDLEAQGYTTETYIIPACSKNAWHKRDRVWIVAYANGIRWSNEQKESGQIIYNGKRNGAIEKQEGDEQQRRISKSSSVYSDTTEPGFQNGRRTQMANTGEAEQELERLCCNGKQLQDAAHTDNTNSEEQRKQITNGTKLFAPRCDSWWKTEPGMGRVVNGLSGRVDRLKGLGNAIVPQVAYELFYFIDFILKEAKKNY